jgi:hypothetical protein
MSVPVTVIYPTCRPEPRFDWFADSLARETQGADVEVVVVDGIHSLDRTRRFQAVAGGRFRLQHVAAKPTPYAGPYRRTGRDYFAAASARNTGLAYARTPYVVYADDLSVVMPGWWSEVQSAASAGCVVAGAYQKHWDMVVADGRLVSSRGELSGLDSRWAQGHDTATVPIAGSQLFGCSFGAPRSLLLEVNGFDELCDSIGGEDWNLGVRVEWSGAEIRYSRRMLTIESEELHRVGPVVLRRDKTAPPSVYMRRLREFGVSQRHVAGNWDSSHMIVDVLFGTRSAQPQGNCSLVEDLNPVRFGEMAARLPTHHWFDREPLSAL